MATESGTGTPTSTPTKGEREAAEGINHLIQGKRHLLVQDIPSAVNSFQEACKLLAAHYGDLAPECAEAYFYYGKALLEAAREENCVLGNALDGGEEEEDADSDDDEESQTEDKENQSEESEEASEEDRDEDIEKSDESQPEAPVKQSAAETSEAEPQPGSSTEKPGTSEQKEEEDEEISNLQLAWEMLELAKLIFSKQAEADRAVKLKLAQVYLKLGEVSLESENYSQSIEDLQNCLVIQRELLEPDDRLLAETYYQLGLSYSFHNDFDLAVENFQNAHKVIEDRIHNLSLIVKGKDTEKGKDLFDEDNPVRAAENEIEELKLLLPEIMDKIADTHDMKKNAHEGVRAAAAKSVQIIAAELSEPSPSENARPISNITHLVKRKRKPDDDEVAAGSSEIKRSKADNSVSTSSSVISSSQGLLSSRMNASGSGTEADSSGSKSVWNDSEISQNGCEISSTADNSKDVSTSSAIKLLSTTNSDTVSEQITSNSSETVADTTDPDVIKSSRKRDLPDAINSQTDQVVTGTDSQMNGN